MTDEQLKRLLQEGMEREAEEIMKVINSDPTLKDVKCPEEVHDRLFEQIRLYEEQKAQEARDQLSHEDKELLRLGTIYRRRRKWSRYVVLAAALVAVLAVGTVSMGENEKLFEVFSRMFAGNEQTAINSGETEPVLYLNEDEAYEKIENTYGFVPVKMEYLPSGIQFQEAVFGDAMQGINMVYGTKDNANIFYVIRPNYRDGSFGTNIEDELLQEYQIIIEGVRIAVKEYNILESGENRWSICFEYQDVQYLLRITNMQQIEVEKIINDLFFL